MYSEYYGFDVNNGSQNSNGLPVISISCMLATVNMHHSSTYTCTGRTLPNFINANIVNPVSQGCLDIVYIMKFHSHIILAIFMYAEILLSFQIKIFTLRRTGSPVFGRCDMQIPNTFALP